MGMKIGIHNGKGKDKSWNHTWIRLCETEGISHIILDCYSPNIIDTLKRENVTHLLWAFSLKFPKDLLVARSILNSAEKMGIKVFPNFESNWHFEDKIAQKYLLESVDADVVKSWAFFDFEDAKEWILKRSTFPIVGKLRRGAGSFNVVLLKNRDEAIKYAKKLFSVGVNPSPNFSVDLKNRTTQGIKKYGPKGFLKKLGSIPNKIKASRNSRSNFTNEKGYVYFQEFLPDNTHDLRIAVIGDRAWGFYRGVRKGDFRASGSGVIDYDKTVPKTLILKSIELSKKLGARSLAFDYVADKNGTFRIVEISYGYVSQAIANCSGYWDSKGDFHSGSFVPEKFILQDLIEY